MSVKVLLSSLVFVPKLAENRFENCFDWDNLSIVRFLSRDQKSIMKNFMICVIKFPGCGRRCVVLVHDSLSTQVESRRSAVS